MTKLDEHDPLYDDTNLSENEEIKTRIKRSKGGKVKTLKERIQEEMVLTNEDKLIFEIIGENPNLSKYEKEGRRAFRDIVIKTCEKCKKEFSECPHYFNPIFTKDWKFKCFIKKMEKLNRQKKPRPKVIPSINLEKYLDKAIDKWRNELSISRTKEDKLIAKCYIDAFQSIRTSMLGELKPKEEK